MIILDPGHKYILDRLDDEPYFQNFPLIFVKRYGEKYPGNTSHHCGTNIQEVLRVLIDRIKYLDNQIHDDLNSIAIHNLRECMFVLESRAAIRHGRKLSFSDPIEFAPTCKKCGHIGCGGECHDQGT